MRVKDLTPRVRSGNQAADARHVFRTLMQGLEDQRRYRLGVLEEQHEAMCRMGMATPVYPVRQ